MHLNLLWTYAKLRKSGLGKIQRNLKSGKIAKKSITKSALFSSMAMNSSLKLSRSSHTRKKSAKCGLKESNFYSMKASTHHIQFKSNDGCERNSMRWKITIKRKSSPIMNVLLIKLSRSHVFMPLNCFDIQSPISSSFNSY